MTGRLLLEGGAEFGGDMADPDRRAIYLAGGPDVAISIIPTAAAADNNHLRAGHNGVRWFNSLGARRVESVALVDRASADRPEIAEALLNSRLIYLLGGFPGYLAQALRGSRAWQAVLDACAAGAVLGGSSAGAMVLCEYFYNPYAGKLEAGLNLLPNACVLPHHESAGGRWAARLLEQLPGVTLVGIDEQTGIIDDGENDAWTVYGKGEITLYRDGKIIRYHRGATFLKTTILLE